MIGKCYNLFKQAVDVLMRNLRASIKIYRTSILRGVLEPCHTNRLYPLAIFLKDVMFVWVRWLTILTKML